jgi:AcrR family transcriptional regulator
MNEKRLQLLDDAEAGTGSDGPSLESVVSAFLHPVVRNWKRGDRWPRRMKLMARAMIELGPKSEDLKRHLFAEVARRFLPALARCAPHLGRAELAWRFYFAIGAMNFAFHAHEQSGEPENQLFPLLDEQRVPELLLHHMVNTFQTPALLPSDASEIGGFATGEVER